MEQATIKPGMMTTTSICDSEITIRLEVIERKGQWSKINYRGETRRVKVRTNRDGREYLMPDSYSMCPIFFAK